MAFVELRERRGGCPTLGLEVMIRPSRAEQMRFDSRGSMKGVRGNPAMVSRCRDGGYLGVLWACSSLQSSGMYQACRDKHTQSPQGSSMAYHSPGAPKRLLPGSRQLGRLGD